MSEPLILLAEDREDDICLIRKAFEKTHFGCHLQVVNSGEEVLAYLVGEGKYAVREIYPLPTLLLLDIKMPGIDGFEVLAWIRKQPALQTLRVVVLTSSAEIRDMNRAYQLGANSFLVKPDDFEHFTALSQALQTYWLKFDGGSQSIRASTTPETPNDGGERQAQPGL